jgi:hypothetical protein
MYQFNYSTSPFTFAVARTAGNAQPIFNTGGTRLVFKARACATCNCTLLFDNTHAVTSSPGS